MSVNGLGFVSGAHMMNKGKIDTPFKLQRNRIHSVHVQRDQQTNGTFVPTENDQTVFLVPLKLREHGTHQKAAAAKHIVLPTYIGSRNTLYGKVLTRASIMMPK
jgi:hypothetical protein